MSDLSYISLEALIDNASIGILVSNSNGIMLLVNPFLLDQFGYTENELIGQSIEKLMPARFHGSHSNKLSHYSQDPRKRPMGFGLDLAGIKKDGTEFPVEISLGDYQFNSEKFIVAFLSDITKRKESENALKLLNEELEQKIEIRTEHLRKAEADLRIAFEKERETSSLKSRFISVASHEFRTPLSTILSSAYLLSKYAEIEQNHSYEKHLKRIVSAVNLLTDILNDFLSVGKIEEGNVTLQNSVFNIKNYIDETISELEILLKTDQRIHYSHIGDPLIKLDAHLLKHIIINLLSNAIKFSSEGSLIEIKSLSQNNKLTLSFSDQGIGISEDDLSHLTERFYRGKNVMNIQGTGLGLHIISKYIELMNGTIHCESKLGDGSKFIVSFILKNDQNEND